MENQDILQEVQDIFDIRSVSSSRSEADTDDYDSTASEFSQEKPNFDELVDELKESIDGFGENLQELAVDSVGKEDSVNESNNNSDNKMQENEMSNKQESDDIDDVIGSVVGHESDSNDNLDVDALFAQENQTSGDVSDNQKFESVDELSESSDDSNAQNVQLGQNNSEDSEDSENSESLDSLEDASNDTREADESIEEGSSEGKNDGEFSVFSKDKGITWLLNSPSEKFEGFYQKKRDMLNDLLIDGVIPINRYQDELRMAKIELHVGSYDIEDVLERLKEAHGWRDRVKEITLEINQQCNIWERALEILRGQLALIEYFKPATRQDGLNYDHLRDFELYYQRIKGLLSSANMVQKHLESASDILNRQITIYLNYSETEVEDRTEGLNKKYRAQQDRSDSASQGKKQELQSEKKSSSQKTQSSEGLSDIYDSIDEGQNVKKKSSGVDFVDW